MASRPTPLRRWGNRVAMLCSTAAPLTPYGVDFAAHDLHIDEDVVCPRCLRWISPDDIVRRTVYGVAQHEACPHPA